MLKCVIHKHQQHVAPEHVIVTAQSRDVYRDFTHIIRMSCFIFPSRIDEYLIHVPNGVMKS